GRSSRARRSWEAKAGGSCALPHAEVHAGGRHVAGERGEGGGRPGDLLPHADRVVEAAAAEPVPEQPPFGPDAGRRLDRLAEALGVVGHVHPGAGPLREASCGQPPRGELHER
ncbi:MAG: hypothetical protein ACK55I_29875, partial [bacterium]